MILTDTLWPRLNQSPSSEAVAAVPPGDGIPRVLHQILLAKEVPPPLQEAMDRNRSTNPGWQHRLYHNAEIIDFIQREYGGEILKSYLRIDARYGAARADLFRYLLMYRCGGVYLDAKSVTTRPLDEVLRADDVYILSQWHGERFAGMGMGVHPELRGIEGTEYQQWHIIAAPGHPFLKAVIENVLRNLRIYNPGIHGFGKTGVLNVTGPIAYTLAIHPLLSRYPHRFVRSDTDLGVDYSVMMTGRNTSAHFGLFPQHYSQLREPLVPVGTLKKLYGIPFRATRKLLRMARR